MKYTRIITDQDQALTDRYLKGFIPDEIYDIHVHPYEASHFSPGVFSFLNEEKQLSVKSHIEALQNHMPVKKLHGSILACHIKRPT